jgi:hypothetical protein
MKKLVMIFAIFFAFLLIGKSANACDCEICRLFTGAEKLHDQREAKRQGVNPEIYTHMKGLEKNKVKPRIFLTRRTKTEAVISQKEKPQIKLVSAKNAYKFSNEELYVPPTD